MTQPIHIEAKAPLSPTLKKGKLFRQPINNEAKATLSPTLNKGKLSS